MDIKKRTEILPEALYKFENLDFNDLVERFEERKPVTGFVLSAEADRLVVRVGIDNGGNDILGYLPFKDATIYPLSFSENPNMVLPIQIHNLIRRQVRVIIEHIGIHPILSRSANMVNAIEHIRKSDCCFCKITNVTSQVAFADIGDGICGVIKVKNASRTRIRSISEVIHTEDQFWAKVLSYTEEYQSFDMGYKHMFKDYRPNDYRPGDSIEVTVCEPVDILESGYFVRVTPTVSGIVDRGEIMPIIPYGSKIMAKIRASGPKGLKLSFIRYI